MLPSRPQLTSLSSNGDPSHEESLHTLKLDNNKYRKAIISCGNILKEYDSY